MKKDEEENKKKVFGHIKRIKENAVRRNRTQLSNGSGNVNPATLSSTTNPETRSLNNPATLLATPPTETGQEGASEASPQAADQAIAAQPLADASKGTSASTDKKPGESEPVASAPDENNCSICLRENTNPALCNECFHCFCFPCIQQWSEQSNQCPVCRREYGLILYNIRSETEYDQMPVQPRRRFANEFEIILPLNHFFEVDDALTRFLQVPPLLPFPPPLQNAFMRGNPAAALMPPTGLAARARDPELAENMISLSVTNYNQPDANGNRVIQRTFFFAEPNTADQGVQLTPLTNMNTPSTSLEQNQPQFGDPFFQSSPIQDPMQQRQPTVVFNPSYGAQPYRNLPGGTLDRHILPTFSTLPATPFGMTTPNNGVRTAQQPMQTLDSIFEQIFNDLTHFPAGARPQHFLSRRSFPTTENSTNSTQLDPTDSPDTFENPIEQLDSAFSVILPTSRRSHRRGRGRRGTRRGNRGTRNGSANRDGNQSSRGGNRRGNSSSNRRLSRDRSRSRRKTE